MNKIEEIYENVKERLTSPLIFSYLVAWTVLNWKVVVALFWWDPKQFAQREIKTIFDFIEANTTRENSIETPLAYAFAYTIGYPLLKVIISGWQTFLGTLEDKINLRINKGHKVPLSRYLALRDEQVALNNQLVQIVEEDSENRKKVIEAQQGMSAARLEREAAKKMAESESERNASLINSLNSIQNAKLFDGYWIVSRTDKKRMGAIQFDNNNIFWLMSDKPQIIGKITTFLCDTRKLDKAVIITTIPEAGILPQTIFQKGNDQSMVMTRTPQGGEYKLVYHGVEYILKKTLPKKQTEIKLEE